MAGLGVAGRPTVAVGVVHPGVAPAFAFGALIRRREPQGPVLVALFLAGAIGTASPASRSPDAPDREPTPNDARGSD